VTTFRALIGWILLAALLSPVVVPGRAAGARVELTRYPPRLAFQAGGDFALYEGWNPIESWPGRTISGPDGVVDAFESMVEPGPWVSVAHYDGQTWQQTFREAPLPAFNTLYHLHPGADYWLFTEAEGALHVPPAPATPAKAVYLLETTEPVVALTFDAGSDRGHTALILDILADEGVRASFGLTGRWAEQNPDLVERIAREGHIFINHSYSHASWTGVSDGSDGLPYEERAWEVAATEEILGGLTGHEAKPYFRSPYGDWNASVQADLHSFGYYFNFLWSMDSLGWAGASPEEIWQRSMDGLEPGAIFIYHVGSTSEDAAALRDIIHGARERGYGFTTVDRHLPDEAPGRAGH
jgi:peptidoglycan/xylan/chitin deacetylase (PgdA/CDA1 family)